MLPGPPTPRAARGHVFREITSIANDRVSVDGDEIEPPWTELAPRLAEAACARLLTSLEHAGHKCAYDLETAVAVHESARRAHEREAPP